MVSLLTIFKKKLNNRPWPTPDGPIDIKREAWMRPTNLNRSPKQYIIFTDSDEDDTMAITIMAIQQALYNDVEILGIVVEDGFLTIDQGLHWLSYWMQSLFPQLQIPLIRGFPREPYLNQTRYFPASWVSEYTGLLDVYYPTWSSTTPAEELPEPFITSLLSSKETRGPYYILSIGPTTTLPKLLELYPAFCRRAIYGMFDLGSIVPHLEYPGTCRWAGGNVLSISTCIEGVLNVLLIPHTRSPIAQYYS